MPTLRHSSVSRTLSRATPRSGRRLLALLASLVAPALLAQSASVWTGAAGDGLWATAANWTSGVPNGDTATADFSQLEIAADTSIAVESITVNRLVFGDITPGGGNLFLTDPLFSYTLTLAGDSPTITVGDLGANLVSFANTGGPITLIATGGFTKDGPGRLELSGNNTFGGSRVIVSAGTLGAPNASSLNSASVVELAGGNLALGSGTYTLSHAIEVTANGALTFGSNSKTITGAISGPAGVVLTVGQSSGASVTTSFAGDLSGYRGELVLANRYYRLDTTYVPASGANAIWTINAGVTGAGTSDGALFYRNGTNGTATFSLGALQGTGVLRGGGAAGTGTVFYEIGALGLDTIFSGLVLDTPAGVTAFTKAGLVKVGAGSLTLAGSNIYTGPTTISAGSLVINGDQSASTGAITVAVGATLRGTGVLGGAATVSGVLAPGVAATPGALTTRANLTLAAGSTLRLRADAAAHDTLVIENPDNTGATSRTLALGGALRLEVGAATPLGETNLIDRDALVTLSGDFATAELVVGAEPAITLQSVSGVWVGTSHDRDYAFDPVTGALTISSASTATALESWRLAHLQSAEPVGDAANDADPDGDGLPNLLEYALGTLPREANASPLVLARTGNDRLTLTFPVRDDASLIYTVQASDDLATWSPVFESNGATLAAAGPAHTVTDPEPLSTHPRRFLRLVVGIAP